MTIGLFIAGLLAAFMLGVILTALLLNEKHAEELESFLMKIEEFKKKYAPKEKDPSEHWLTWEDREDGEI